MNGAAYDRWRLACPDEEQHDTRCPAHEDNEGDESEECECDELKLYDADEEMEHRWDLMQEAR